ncbi:hypothetical protein GGD83_002556 [Rhodoblastus sphagnicola]|uniref:GDSL-type esterase/lipase family protein n=1 Tax=Rhodoblastus sphagnicola TaxID=333368 RepID=UPI0011AFD32E|nr:GDSL-type esterase/lipase family protein [Rhodoblastus sphagnicola]MBB4198747.1 hypothetical protein [Rhodoblastus sphagnicola]
MKVTRITFAAICFSVIATHAAAETCDPTDVLVTTTPIPPQSGVSLKRHLQLKALMGVPQPTKTVLLGDSLVQMWPQVNAPNALNLGDGNDKTQNVLWRLANMNLSSVSPENVVLLVGTNNFGPSDPNCSVVAGVAAILDVVQGAWPRAHTTLIEIPPRGPLLQFRIAERLALNRSLRQMAMRRKNVTPLNVDEAMGCLPASPCSNFLPDMVHFSPGGYAILQQLIPFLGASK